MYTEIVPNCLKATLQAIIRGKIKSDTTIHSDGWRGYDGLVDLGYDKHFRVHHGVNEFVRGESHINGIESFWSYAKRRLAQLMAYLKKHFIFILKKQSLDLITDMIIYTLKYLRFYEIIHFNFLRPKNKYHYNLPIFNHSI